MTSLRSHWPRLLGPLLLGILVWNLDVRQVSSSLRSVSLFPFAAAMLLNLPQLGLKSLRWQYLMRSQKIEYGTKDAFLAYLGSIFVGLLTPGRLGELAKAFHIVHDCQVSLAKAFASVLADRLFDLYLLLLVGGAAFLSLVKNDEDMAVIWIVAFFTVLPLVLFFNDTTFHYLEQIGLKLGTVGRKLFAEDGWLLEIRQCLRQLSKWQALRVSGLTIGAYSLLFIQCYLVAVAVGLPAGFVPVSFAIALGSLVTLIPISISGLGTREAALIAYLGMFDVLPEAALSFSLLIFATLYIAGGLMGAAAWWLKPIPFGALR